MTATLKVVDGIPRGLCDCPAEHLAEMLGGPTLLNIKGERDLPLFVSVLLHGNEVSGWNGLRRLLAEPGQPPRSLTVLIGNVDAAAAGLRTLPSQQDFNRIWRDGDNALTNSVLQVVRRQRFFAAIDLHNNTGHNPHYAIVTDLHSDHLGLAYMFSDRCVFIDEPDTVLTRVLADVCPAVAVELGPVGDPGCDDRAFDYLKRCSVADTIADDDLDDLSLYKAAARVHVAADIEFGFAGDDDAAPLLLTGGMEAVNFHAVPEQTEFGATQQRLGEVIKVLDNTHQDVTSEYFESRDGRILLRRTVIPAMYTTDPVVIRQDCLCYFMDPMPRAQPSRA